MAVRTFRDAKGVEWQVWTVTPRIERASNALSEYVAPELRNGWLAFRSESEVRRLAPVDPRWETMPEESLRDLLERATHRSSGGRRLVE